MFKTQRADSLEQGWMQLQCVKGHNVFRVGRVLQVGRRVVQASVAGAGSYEARASDTTLSS